MAAHRRQRPVNARSRARSTPGQSSRADRCAAPRTLGRMAAPAHPGRRGRRGDRLRPRARARQPGLRRRARWPAGGPALGAAADADVGLVILDLGLPDIDGIDVCRAPARARAPTCAILILTARDQELDVVAGLDAGADDYLVKPFRLVRAARARARPPAPRAAAAERAEAAEPLRGRRRCASTSAARRAWRGERGARAAPEGVRPARAAGRRGRPRGHARADHARGLGHRLARLDEDARHARPRRCAASSAPSAITTLRGVGYRLRAAVRRRLVARDRRRRGGRGAAVRGPARRSCSAAHYRDEELLRLQRDTVAATREIDLPAQRRRPGRAAALAATRSRSTTAPGAGVAGARPGAAPTTVRARAAHAAGPPTRAGDGRLVGRRAAAASASA